MTLHQLNQMPKIKKCISLLEAEPEAEIVTDSVKGSMCVFPYIIHNTKITGLSDAEKKKQNKLMELKEKYKSLELFIYSIEDLQLRNIFCMRFIKCMRWRSIARKIGGNNTEDSVKKMVYRHLIK